MPRSEQVSFTLLQIAISHGKETTSGCTAVCVCVYIVVIIVFLFMTSVPYNVHVCGQIWTLD